MPKLPHLLPVLAQIDALIMHIVSVIHRGLGLLLHF